MAKSELIAEFRAHLASFERYQGFIDKARSYADRFNPAVVERVIADNSARIHEVAAQLDPLVPQLRQVVASLEEQRDGITQGAEDSRSQLEELELRLAIGEIDEESFELSTIDLRAQLETVDQRVGEVDAELGDFQGALNAWLSARPEPQEEVNEDLLDPDDDDGIDLDEGDDVGVADEHPSVQPPSADGVADDVSAVFTPPSDATDASDDDAAGADQDDAPLEGEDAGIDFAPSEISDLGDDLLAEESKGGGAGATSGVRRAVLILGEGTNEEHVYPFGTEPITIGRGRDNTIQVKNDSKVSRQHCRVFKRGSEFYVEDNKSANGTSVDGDLIPEKRLVGGEMVQVGETPFRFRVEVG